MKKNYLLLSAVLLLFSCSNAILPDEESTVSDLLAQPKTWQKQLEYAQKNNDLKTKTSFQGISFQGYTYKGKIDREVDIPVIIEELLSDNSAIVQYTDLNFSNFEIIPIGMVRQSVKTLSSEDPFSYLKSQLQTSIMIGMELLELEWTYKGDTFYSTAIVSNEHGGLIYDNIGIYIIEKSSKLEQKDKEIELNVPLVKTKSESEGPVVRQFSQSDSGRNYYGQTVFSYSISCNSYFNAGVLYDRKLRSSHDSAFGWSCSADVRTISGQINISTYHEFAWAYAYGAACSVSIGWNGNGFKISGGGTGSTGTTVHRQ